LDYSVDRGPSATNPVGMATALQPRPTTHFVRTRLSCSAPALPRASATPAVSLRPAQPRGGAPRLERTSSRVQPAAPRCLTVVEFLRKTIPDGNRCCAKTGAGMLYILKSLFTPRSIGVRLILALTQAELPRNRAPASLADLALIKAIARGRQWADDLLAGRDHGSPSMIRPSVCVSRSRSRGVGHRRTPN
jgi:hypothetical protein